MKKIENLTKQLNIMKFKNKLQFLLVLLITQQSVFAQQSDILGRISDAAENIPLEFVNVSLLKQDSTFITGVVSDEKGLFKIPNIPIGDYLISASYIGYKTGYNSISHTAIDSYIEIQLQPSSIMLHEVGIVAQAVINKSDRKLIIPSKQQISTSTDGLDLMRKLQLPLITVNPMNNKVSTSGYGEVQLRINGIQVTSTEIRTLKPDDIIRIEYHDDPSVRYGNASVVINYITHRNESGGSIEASSGNNLGKNKTSSDNLLAMRFNHKKSEFSANASYEHRKQYWTREYNEIFVYPTRELHRIENGESTPFDDRSLSADLNYSLVEKDKYFFNVQLRYNDENTPFAYEDRKSTIMTSDLTSPISIYDHSTERRKSPALDLYFQHNMKGEQSVIFNVVGTYIDSKNTRIYQEQKDNILETDIVSNISGNKYSLIAEGIYERKIGDGKLTGGLKYMQVYANNKYSGSNIANVSMKQSEGNIYAEYEITKGKWGYMVNLTTSRLYYSQERNNIEKYALQPSARITYNPTSQLFFRYRLNLRNNMPSLSYLNNVEQIIDPLQIRKGNPNLNSYENLMQNFSAGYKKGILNIDLLLGYNYQFKPIMESVLYDKNKNIFIRTYENQKSFQNLSAEITFKVQPWKDHMILSVTPRLNRYISKGNSYTHTYTMKDLQVNLDLMYKNYMLSFMTLTPPNRDVYGEQLMQGDLMHIIMAGYRQANWSVMAGVFNPFVKTYKAKNENWAVLNPVQSEIHTKNMSNTIFVKFSFNIDFGKQFNRGNKQVDNNDTDSGIMSGSKN